MKKILIASLFLTFIISFTYGQRVFMTGDSHVSGKIYPEEVGKILQSNIDSLEYSFWGKAGAGFYSFNDNPEYMDTIFNYSPDILIVHLGTNGSYNAKYTDEKMIADMETFQSLIRERLPEVKIVYVTPFDNKKKSKTGKKKKSTSWIVNPNTKKCSEAINAFSNSHSNTYVIDNNGQYGMTFINGGSELIRNDYVHLTIKGYELLGEQVGNALLEIPGLFLEVKNE